MDLRLKLKLKFAHAIPSLKIFPTTFNEDKHAVVLFNVVFPETFNDGYIVLICWNQNSTDF